MLKAFVLQALYGLSDGALATQIRDRSSFQRFLGLTPGDPVANAHAIWKWRERP
ncbi:MAG TPA: transposase, partial [Nitratifractor salsuginis]|nr:transposase [Nitratifractor salsuginis]